MRRPSAIPTSPPPAQTERAEQSRPADGRVDVDTETAPIVLTAPLVPASPLTVSEAVAVVPDEEGDGSDAEPDGPLTARDLWQAARARRRALRTEIRRFTQRSRRRRIGWIIAIAASLLVIGGSVGAAYSPLFAVQTITVEGTATLKPADVEKALSSQVGRPLALVDASAVKAALVGFPLIETYRLEAHPPHDLVVRIVERTPVGVVEEPGRFTVVDVAGVALSTTEQRPDGYALIDAAGGTGSSAFAAVATALRSLPADLRAQVVTASATTPDDIVLQLSAGAKVVWGSADGSAEKTLALLALMKANPDASSYDVSSPGVGVVG